MADAIVNTPAPRRRRNWLRIIGGIVGILIVLLIILYFVATSSAFFKGVILPRVSKSLNADVTVSDASISPFKQVILHNLKVQPANAEPLVTAPEVRLRYSLMDIIGGNIRVDEAALVSPTVTLVTNPDGSSNLDPILKAQKEQAKVPPKEKKAPPPAKPSKPAQIDIKKVALTDATVRTVKLYKGGNRDVAEISHLNVTLDNLKNGQTGKLAVNADMNVQNNPPPPAAGGALQAKLNGGFTFALTPDLKPASIQGNTRLEVARAEGALAQLAAFAGNLNCDVTPTDIKEVALRFQRGDTRLGELRVSGPFDMDKTEGRLTVELLDIDKNLLNLAGASSGMDFGPTTINSTNEIQLAKAGAAVTAAGQFNLNHLQLTRTNQTTPPLDLHADYNVSVDRAASNALLRAFNLNGMQKGKPVLHGELTSPMTIAWGNANSSAIGDSTLNLAVTHLDLADWQPFLGDVAPAGDVNGKLQLLSQQGGKQLTFDLNSQINNLTAGSGSNQITQATVTLLMRGRAADMKQFNFPEYKLVVARQEQPLLTASGSGTYDKAAENADLQLNAQVMLARLLQALPRPDVNVSSGSAELKARLTQKQKDQTVTGNFTLADFTGQFGSNNFRSFGTVADFDLGMTPQQVQIRKVVGKITEGVTVGGTFNLSGTYDLTNKSAQLTAQLANFNQAGLRPFLEPMLADKKLVSVALNANASAQYDPQAASAVKADLQMTNLVVNDPKGQFPATPLEAKMQMDASLNKQVATLRQLQIALTPTARATNLVQLTGQVDMSQTNAITGNLKLASDSLDLTSYYDLFGGQKKTAEQKPAPATRPTPPSKTAPAPSAPETEPPAKQLPFRNFIADANIRRIYLHEVEIADLQTSAKIDGGHVALNPCKLMLNGAPVDTTVDADLGVPGYKYAFAFNAQAVPLAPLVNSFQPERKGILSGTLTAQAKADGAGITGASLRKTLTGQFDLNSTNLNLSIDSIQGTSASTRLLKALLNTIATIPELAKNPAGGATTLLEGLTGRGGGATGTGEGGLSADLKKSPINSIILRGVAGSGRVELQQALIQSPAFEAQASGTITLADVLTNSTLQIPVSVSLERSIAQRIRLAGNAPPNAAYAKLPDFLTMKGTLGDPKRQINYAALAGTALQGVGGTAGQVGGALQGLGTIFGGKQPANTNAPSSAAPPATNQSPVNNLLNQFLKPKR